MAISQKQFAAEVLDADDNATKFDDIGCTLGYLRSAGQKPAAVFVTDYGSRQWVNARSAVFVEGSKVQTPMRGGILAFGDRARADAAAREYGGTVRLFTQLAAP